LRNQDDDADIEGYNDQSGEEEEDGEGNDES